MGDILYIVVPCYKEEEVLPETAARLKEKLSALIKSGRVSPKSKITFVNDGSTDSTWKIITELHNKDNMFSGINLSRNRGHQNALLAGLMTIIESADLAISMDADLQDDINAVDKMLDKYYQGNDIVYGVRSARDTDTFFKRITAEGFYKLIEKLGAKIVFNHADYRLMSKRALLGLKEFGEVNLFLRGIVPMIGYKSDIVTYERGERFAGESKYPLKKMLAFAFEGITSLTVSPIRFITGLGFLLSASAMLTFVFLLFHYLSGGVPSQLSIILISLWLIGGIQIFCLGILGEYIGKIYMETKKRPRFIIDEFINDDNSH